jgi:hypothetical protein
VAGWSGEAVAVVGLLVVVVGAEPAEVVEGGGVGEGPAGGVVDLEAPGDVAAGDFAALAAGFEGAALVGGDVAAEVHDPADVLAVLDLKGSRLFRATP